MKKIIIVLFIFISTLTYAQSVKITATNSTTIYCQSICVDGYKFVICFGAQKYGTYGEGNHMSIVQIIDRDRQPIMCK